MRTGNKIAVVGYSGNAGKTLTTVHLLAPRLPDHEILRLETFNASSNLVSAVTIGAKRFEPIFDRIISSNRIIIDIGASNIREALDGMTAHEGFLDEIDLFLIPTLPEDKPQADTLKLVSDLADLGVEKERILIVLNRVHGSSPEEVETEFKDLFEVVRDDRKCLIDPVVAIPDLIIFEQLEEVHMTVDDVLNLDEGRIRREIANRTPEKENALRILSIQMRARAVKQKLDTVFKAMGLR